MCGNVIYCFQQDVRTIRKGMFAFLKTLERENRKSADFRDRKMNETFQCDYKRTYRKELTFFGGRLRLLLNPALKFAYFGRKQSKIGFLNKYYRFRAKCIGKKCGLEIDYTKVGKGLVLAHPYGITINPSAIIGENVTIFKGATIGSVRSGKNKGVPTIGDRVTICCNAFVCGNVRIGNDVLIAANAFVNFDVPDNSVVIGNPGQIKHKEDPSRDYL